MKAHPSQNAETKDGGGGVAAQSCLILCDPAGCSPPGSSVHEISQARILKCVAISFSRELPDPGIKPRSPALQVDSLGTEPPGKTSDKRKILIAAREKGHVI